MKTHFFKAGKEKLIKSVVPGYVTLCKICGKKAIEHKNWKEDFMRTAKAIQKSQENYPIKKLGNINGVKMSSTLGGQRELLRQYRNKINEIIEWINNYEERQSESDTKNYENIRL